MDRRKNNKGIYNAFLYGAIGYAVVSVICIVAGNWNTAIAYLCTTAICGAAYYSVKRISKENEDMAEMVEKNRWIDIKCELPNAHEQVLVDTDKGIFLGTHWHGEFLLSDHQIGYVYVHDCDRYEYREVRRWKRIH